MTVLIKHAFVSAKGDGTDATLLKPSDWNAAHTTSMTNNMLLGNISGSTGPFTEIGLTPFMAALLNSADANVLAGMLGLFSTGDVKWTLATSPSAGWIICNNGGTIGNAASGATIRANSDTQALYQMLWDNCAQADAPVTGGRGASGAVDFASNKPLQVPYLAGRSPMGAGGAIGTTSARVLGRIYGEENHVLNASEIPSILSTTGGGIGISVSSTVASILQSNQIATFAQVGGNNPVALFNASVVQTISAITSTGITPTINSASSNTGGSSHNTIHPVVALNPMVKL